MNENNEALSRREKIESFVQGLGEETHDPNVIREIRREYTPRRKESMQDIISAVSAKDDVVSAFKPNKPGKQKSIDRSEGNVDFYLRCFTGGILFVFAALLTVAVIAALAYVVLLFVKPKLLKLIIAKAVYVVKHLGAR